MPDPTGGVSARAGTPPIQPAKEFLQRYDLLGLLGEGGTGVVMRVRDRVLGRDLAVKFLRGSMAGEPDFVARFEREARLTAALRHPNVIRVFDSGVTAGAPYIVYELLEAMTLKDCLVSAPMDLDELLPIEIALLEGLAHAHDRGVLHRDLKPENILLTADGEPKLTDFGFASDAASAHDTSERSVILGTPAYLAPEILAGEPASRASDLYAAGAVLFEMVYRRPAFSGPNPRSIVDSVLAGLGALPPAPAIPTRLAVILRSSLSADPADRPPSAADFAAELTSIFESGALVESHATVDIASSIRSRSHALATQKRRITSAVRPVEARGEVRTSRPRVRFLPLAIGVPVVLAILFSRQTRAPDAARLHPRDADSTRAPAAAPPRDLSPKPQVAPLSPHPSGAAGAELLDFPARANQLSVCIRGSTLAVLPSIEGGTLGPLAISHDAGKSWNRVNGFPFAGQGRSKAAVNVSEEGLDCYWQQETHAPEALMRCRLSLDGSKLLSAPTVLIPSSSRIGSYAILDLGHEVALLAEESTGPDEARGLTLYLCAAAGSEKTSCSATVLLPAGLEKLDGPTAVADQTHLHCVWQRSLGAKRRQLVLASLPLNGARASHIVSLTGPSRMLRWYHIARNSTGTVMAVYGGPDPSQTPADSSNEDLLSSLKHGFGFSVRGPGSADWRKPQIFDGPGSIAAVALTTAPGGFLAFYSEVDWFPPKAIMRYRFYDESSGRWSEARDLFSTHLPPEHMYAGYADGAIHLFYLVSDNRRLMHARFSPGDLRGASGDRD